MGRYPTTRKSSPAFWEPVANVNDAGPVVRSLLHIQYAHVRCDGPMESCGQRTDLEWQDRLFRVSPHGDCDERGRSFVLRYARCKMDYLQLPAFCKHIRYDVMAKEPDLANARCRMQD